MNRFIVFLALSLLVLSSEAGVMMQALHGKLPGRTAFMPKGELLMWVNTLIQCEFSEVTQCANGAAYCCVLDALFPVTPVSPHPICAHGWRSVSGWLP
jgi:hypothetical protein